MTRRRLEIDLTKRLTPDSRSRIEWLRAAMEARGVGYIALYKSIPNPPPGLTWYTIHNWCTGDTHSASWAHWRAVKLAVRGYDPRQQSQKKGRLDLTDRLTPESQSRIEWLRAAMEARGVGAYALYNSMSNPPPGLTYRTIQNWCRGSTQSASWAHWRAVKLALKEYTPPLKKGRGRPIKLRQNGHAAPLPAAPLTPGL